MMTTKLRVWIATMLAIVCILCGFTPAQAAAPEGSYTVVPCASSSKGTCIQIGLNVSWVLINRDFGQAFFDATGAKLLSRRGYELLHEKNPRTTTLVCRDADGSSSPPLGVEVWTDSCKPDERKELNLTAGTIVEFPIKGEMVLTATEKAAQVVTMQAAVAACASAEVGEKRTKCLVDKLSEGAAASPVFRKTSPTTPKPSTAETLNSDEIPTPEAFAALTKERDALKQTNDQVTKQLAARDVALAESNRSLEKLMRFLQDFVIVTFFAAIELYLCALLYTLVRRRQMKQRVEGWHELATTLEIKRPTRNLKKLLLTLNKRANDLMIEFRSLTDVNTQFRQRFEREAAAKREERAKTGSSATILDPIASARPPADLRATAVASTNDLQAVLDAKVRELDTKTAELGARNGELTTALRERDAYKLLLNADAQVTAIKHLNAQVKEGLAREAALKAKLEASQWREEDLQSRLNASVELALSMADEKLSSEPTEVTRLAIEQLKGMAVGVQHSSILPVAEHGTYVQLSEMERRLDEAKKMHDNKEREARQAGERAYKVCRTKKDVVGQLTMLVATSQRRVAQAKVDGDTVAQAEWEQQRERQLDALAIAHGEMVEQDPELELEAFISVERRVHDAVLPLEKKIDEYEGMLSRLRDTNIRLSMAPPPPALDTSAKTLLSGAIGSATLVALGEAVGVTLQIGDSTSSNEAAANQPLVERTSSPDIITASKTRRSIPPLLAPVLAFAAPPKAVEANGARNAFMPIQGMLPLSADATNPEGSPAFMSEEGPPPALPLIDPQYADKVHAGMFVLMHRPKDEVLHIPTKEDLDAYLAFFKRIFYVDPVVLANLPFVSPERGVRKRDIEWSNPFGLHYTDLHELSLLGIESLNGDPGSASRRTNGGIRSHVRQRPHAMTLDGIQPPEQLFAVRQPK